MIVMAETIMKSHPQIRITFKRLPDKVKPKITLRWPVQALCTLNVLLQVIPPSEANIEVLEASLALSDEPLDHLLIGVVQMCHDLR